MVSFPVAIYVHHWKIEPAFPVHDPQRLQLTKMLRPNFVGKGDKALSVKGTQVWNKLQEEIRPCQSFPVCTACYQTHLCATSYLWHRKAKPFFTVFDIPALSGNTYVTFAAHMGKKETATKPRRKESYVDSSVQEKQPVAAPSSECKSMLSFFSGVSWPPLCVMLKIPLKEQYCLKSEHCR